MIRKGVVVSDKTLKKKIKKQRSLIEKQIISAVPPGAEEDSGKKRIFLYER